MSRGKLSRAVQENILALVCFHTKEAMILRGLVDPGLFDMRPYRQICTVAYAYLDRYKQAAGPHIYDELEDLIDGKDREKAQAYTEILESLDDFKDSVNAEYVLTQVREFVRKQRMKQGILAAADLLQEDDLDGAEAVIHEHLKQSVDLFDPGIDLSSEKDVSTLLAHDDQDEIFPTGIEALDQLKVGPERGTLYIHLGIANSGKSFALGAIGKACALARYNVIHITLEMSEKKVARRYMQAFHSLTKAQAEKVQVSMLNTSDGVLLDITTEEIERPGLFEKKRTKKLVEKHLKLRNTRITIKQFPTGAMTVPMLKSYLDAYEANTGKLTEVVILDYADLMQLSPQNLRVETGALYKELRGIAVERDIAMVTASQSNRSSSSARVVTMEHLSEDFSKAMTADTIVSYTATTEEKRLGLARLFLAKVRDSAGAGVTSILMTQAYGIGQFCLDSMRLPSNYAEVLEAEDEDE